MKNQLLVAPVLAVLSLASPHSRAQDNVMRIVNQDDEQRLPAQLTAGSRVRHNHAQKREFAMNKRLVRFVPLIADTLSWTSLLLDGGDPAPHRYHGEALAKSIELQYRSSQVGS